MRKMLTRRTVLSGLAISLTLPAFRAGAAPIDAGTEFKLVDGSDADQSAKLAAALNRAASQGRLLLLPAGTFTVADIAIPGGVHMIGVPGRTILMTPGDKRLAHLSKADGVLIEGITLAAKSQQIATGVNGLLEIEASTAITFRQCDFRNAAGNSLAADGSAVTIEDCVFDGATAAAIHSQNGLGLMIRGNRISNCGNAGIRIWRDDDGPDGTIITGNRIDKIDWRDGGNGQNGNGVSIYNADGVVVSDNVISSCAFSAIRVNAGKDTQIHGNTCLQSGEVAIFSEFAFSGSVIADNIVDGAATGISITNLDKGGHLATCTGNIVRNIAPSSATNPDTRPVGIYAEAETVVANNTIENVPGVGIAVGTGPYVRDVTVAGNMLSQVQTGIAVSVVSDAPAGPVTISGNTIGAGAQRGIVGMRWDVMASDDLVRDARKYPNTSIANNTIG